jgi:hypothetical protein
MTSITISSSVSVEFQCIRHHHTTHYPHTHTLPTHTPMHTHTQVTKDTQYSDMCDTKLQIFRQQIRQMKQTFPKTKVSACVCVCV